MNTKIMVSRNFFLKAASFVILTSVFIFSSGGINIGGIKPANAKIIAQNAIANHNTESNCWIILNGKVYDITGFLSNHSGGAAAIIPFCGQDITAVFNSKPHPASDIAALSSYYIGDIGIDSTPASAPSPTPAITPGSAITPSPTPSPLPTPSVSPTPTPSVSATPSSSAVINSDDEESDNECAQPSPFDSSSVSADNGEDECGQSSVSQYNDEGNYQNSGDKDISRNPDIDDSGEED